MVGFDMDARSDRAQLILVGAVAIAIIVLGLAVVFNTVLYTENVASTGAASAPRDAQVLNQEIKRSSPKIVKRVNEGARWSNHESDPEDVRDAVLRNITAYSDGITNVSAGQSPVIVSVSEGSDSEMGYAARVQDSDGGDFTDPSGNQKWDVVDDSGVVFRDFELTVEPGALAEGGTGDEFRLLWNESNAEENYTVWVYSATDGDIILKTLATAGGDPTDFSASSNTCKLVGSASETNVTIDVSNGSVEGGYSCSNLDVNSQIEDDELATLQFSDSNNVTGSYSMIVWRDASPSTYIEDPESPSAIPLVGPVDSDDSPYWSYVVWQMELTTSYDSGSVSFSDTYVIEVYNRSR